MPFIQALGYDVFNPLELVPEFTADVGTKKGEKVDYAIFQNGKPIMIFECKCCHSDLDNAHANQLFRYFACTDTRIAILTNGLEYRFFTDIDESNKMDSKPFFEFDLRKIDELTAKEIKKFSKEHFDIEQTLCAASDLRYTKEIKQILTQEIQEPSDEFVTYFTAQVYTGRKTQSIMEQFKPIVKNAFIQFINEKINSRLMSAMEGEYSPTLSDQITHEQSQPENIFEFDDGIITTEEEIEGYHIVKAIVHNIIDDVSRVVMRDTKTYCGILLDDNNRKPICRLWFNGNKKYISLFDVSNNRTEEKIHIENLNDIYKYSEQLRDSIVKYNI
jgi:hypothetical protein